MSLTKVDDNWIPLQVKVFSRWVSSHLRNVDDARVTDITKDLSNGVALVELAEELTHKEPSRQWCEAPRRNVDKVQNCDLAIDMFTKDGVKLVGISGKDVNDNNQKLILGLIWTLILYYSIGKSVNANSPIGKAVKANNDNYELKPCPQPNDDVKNALLEWAHERTSNYPNIHNFAPFDLSLCALLDSYVPEKINYYSLNPKDSFHNSNLAIDVMNDLGIPVYVFPDELSKYDNDIDEKTLLTQLAAAKVVLDRFHSPKSEPATSHVYDRNIVFDEKQDFDSDSNSNAEEIERLTRELQEAKEAAARSKEENMKLAEALADAENQIASQKQSNKQHEEEINKLKESQKLAATESKQLKEALTDKEMELRSEKWEKSKIESEASELAQTVDQLKSEADAQKSEKKRANDEIQRLLKAANDDAENSRKQLKAELKTTKEGRDKLEAQLFTLTKKINEFKNEKDLLAKSLRDIQEEKEAAEREVIELKKSSNSNASDSKNIESQLSAVKAEKEKLDAKMADLSKQVENFKNEKELLAKALRDVQEEKEAAEREVSDLKKSAKMTNAKFIEKELNSARAEKAKLEAKIAELNKQIEGFKNEKELYAKALKDVQEQREEAEAKVDRLTKLNRSNGSFSSSSHDVKRLQNDLRIAESEKQKAMIDLSEVSKERDDANNDKELMARTLRKVQEEKEKAELEVERLSRAVVEAEARIALLEKSLEDSQLEVTQNREAQEFAQGNNNNLSQAYDELQDAMDAKIRDLEGQIEWLGAEKSEIESDAVVLAKALKTAGIEKGKDEEEIGRLSRYVVEAEARIALLEKKLKDSQKEVEDLHEELYFTNDQNNEMTQDSSVLTRALVNKENQVKQLANDNFEARTYATSLKKALARSKDQTQQQRDEKVYAQQNALVLAATLDKTATQAQQNAQISSVIITSACKEIERTRAVAQTYSNALDEALVQLQQKTDENEEANHEIEGLANELQEADDKVERLTLAWQDTRSKYIKTAEELNALNEHAEKLAESYSIAVDDLELERNAREEAEKQVMQLNSKLERANDDIDMLNESLADTEIERDSLKHSLKKTQKRERKEKNMAHEAELQAENLAYNLAMTQAEANRNNNNNDNDVNEREVHLNPENDNSPYYIKGDNKDFAGRRFGLTMTIDGHEYALAWVDDGFHFLNPAGYKLDLVEPNIANDVHQQFTFGKDDWNTVIDSCANNGFVWDVANAQNWNPPNGTAFYLYPFHGRHNQHFVYKNGMIYAKQNGQVVTYVGGNVPFVMVGPNESLKDKQTFHIQLF